jgi:DNA primase
MPMPTLDFAELRRRVPIARVLELLAFRPLRRSGAELRGACPIHRAASPRSRSFAANVEKNLFHCFHCGASGNALELYAAAHRTTVYHAALELCERLNIELPEKRAVGWAESASPTNTF